MVLKETETYSIFFLEFKEITTRLSHLLLNVCDEVQQVSYGEKEKLIEKE